MMKLLALASLMGLTAVQASAATLPPIQFTPTLYQATCGGGNADYAFQKGEYYKIPGTKLVWYSFALYLNSDISPGGSCIGITLPTLTQGGSESVSAGNCSIHYYSGITLDGGYTQLVGNIGSANDNALYLYETGPGLESSNLATSNFRAGQGLFGICSYLSN